MKAIRPDKHIQSAACSAARNAVCQQTHGQPQSCLGLQQLALAIYTLLGFVNTDLQVFHHPTWRAG